MGIFRRLFREHPGLTFLLGFFWIIVSAIVLVSATGNPRRTHNGLVLLLGAAVILVVFAWLNSKHFINTDSALKKHGLTWGSASADFAVLIILFSIPVIVGVPAYGNFGTQYKMYRMINEDAGIAGLKITIAEKAKEKGSLNKVAGNLQIKKPRDADFAWLTSDGKIILYNEEFGVLAELTPVINNNEVEWKCKGYPERLLPSDCRGK